MTEPRRNGLQVHLSTAMVLMFVAGGIIWANTQGRTESNRLIPGSEFFCTDYSEHHYGWPLNEWAHGTTGRQIVLYAGGSINLAVALAILLAVWLICEWWIRRTARKRA